MRRIAVLGANGQVGSEVCLALSLLPSIEVIPIVRSALAAALLTRCGLIPRVGDVLRDDSLLRDADLVADFSLPGGLPSQVTTTVGAGLRKVISAASPGAPYVFISSTMAFGMPAEDTRYRDRWIARSQYAITKRRGERQATRLGREATRPVFVLRLGQVHGELQAVSRAWVAQFEEASSPLRVSDQPTDNVFCASIALALRSIASGEESPGTYALVEDPALRLDEIVRYYIDALRLPLDVEVSRYEPEKASDLAGTLFRRTIAAGSRAAIAHRDGLMGHFLPRRLDAEWWVKARWLRRNVRAELAIPAGTTIKAIAGPVPGRRVQALRGATADAKHLQIRVRQLLDSRLGQHSHSLPLVEIPAARSDRAP